MKTILVDAINGLVLEDGSILEPMHKLLFEKYGLTASDAIYFEHDAEAAKTAQSVGITTYFYDHTKEDMDALKQFLDGNLH